MAPIIDMEKYKRNMDLATEVYINRVDDSPCDSKCVVDILDFFYFCRLFVCLSVHASVHHKLVGMINQVL